MIGAMAWLYRVTGQTGYREAAQRAWAYLERVHLHDGVLAATSRNNLSRGTGFLEDYAFCAFGLLLSMTPPWTRPICARPRLSAKRCWQTSPTPPGAFPHPQGRRGPSRPPQGHRRRSPPQRQHHDGLESAAALPPDPGGHLAAGGPGPDGVSGGPGGAYPTAYPVYLLALLAQREPPEEITVVLAPGEAPPRQPWPFPLDAVVTFQEATQAQPLLEGRPPIISARDTAACRRGINTRCKVDRFVGLFPALCCPQRPPSSDPASPAHLPQGKAIGKPSGAYCKNYRSNHPNVS